VPKVAGAKRAPAAKQPSKAPSTPKAPAVGGFDQNAVGGASLEASLLDALAEAESSAAPETVAPAVASRPPIPCPQCGATVAGTAVLCTQCGFSIETGRSARAASTQSSGGGLAALRGLASGASPMLVGTVAASVAGAIGAAVWAWIAVVTEYEIGYLALLIGGMVGLAMYAANQAPSQLGGLVAGLIAALSIFVAKVIAFEALFDWMLPVGQLAVAIGQNLEFLDYLFMGFALFVAYRVGSYGPSISTNE
jgi:hypothetical protein